MACFCSCIWGNPDPGPVRLKEMQQVVLDTTKMGKSIVLDQLTDIYPNFSQVWTVLLSSLVEEYVARELH